MLDRLISAGSFVGAELRARGPLDSDRPFGLKLIQYVEDWNCEVQHLRRKRLQVFISSTFTDLIQERQAAVEAILTAGHIPAGMELFTAGDQSQMDVIKRWIDESDVYLLILGHRYGSIEPQTKKSYTHLEYEYALEKKIPLFAVVVKSGQDVEMARIEKHGIVILERDNESKLKDFRRLVQTKTVRFWEDPRDIKLAIHETLSEFERRENLLGWIRGSEALSNTVTEELARLTKENERLKKLETTEYVGLTYSEMMDLLKSRGLERAFISLMDRPRLGESEKIIELLGIGLVQRVESKRGSGIHSDFELVPASGFEQYYELTLDGRRLLNRCLLEQIRSDD